MKQYDRQKKEWVSEEELIRRKKARERCRGGNEHDYVEVLPYGVEATDAYAGDPTPFHDAELAIREFTEKKHAELAEIGIVVKRRGYNPFRYRSFMCSVCKKGKHEAMP